MMAWLNIIAIVLLHKKPLSALRIMKPRMHRTDPQFDPVRLGIKNADYWLGERKDEPAANPGQTTSVVREQSAGKLNN